MRGESGLPALRPAGYNSAPLKKCRGNRDSQGDWKMSSLNVYGWIRDSVRRAVLLGFSDAVEQVGTLDGNQNINPQLLSLLKQNPATVEGSAMGAAAVVEAEPETAKPRRRLGRTLDDIRHEERRAG